MMRTKRDLQVLTLAMVKNLDRHGLARFLAANLVFQLRRAMHANAVELPDNIAWAGSGCIGRATSEHLSKRTSRAP